MDSVGVCTGGTQAMHDKFTGFTARIKKVGPSIMKAHTG